MNNILSLIKDLVISIIIAVLTSGLFEASNVVYQSTITILILLIIFLILRGIDRKAKRLEILSILYVENLLLPLMRAINDAKELNMGTVNIRKIKVFIILPEGMEDLNNFRHLLSRLDTIEMTVPLPDMTIRSMSGKIMDQNLLLFDTPMTWLASLKYLNRVKGMSQKKISQLLRKMTDDIRAYTNKMAKRDESVQNLTFISFAEFEKYYT